MQGGSSPAWLGSKEADLEPRGSTVAMSRIQSNAEKHSRTRDPARTFEAGLRWFCDRVKEKVMARLDVEPELSDVVEVCQAWEDGLVVL